ncbi:MAG: signal peptidase I [Chloroflexi bacterium]|nr:signal peptidase I [Chloroflexota bacterium]
MDLVALMALLGLGYLAIAFSMGTLRPIGAVISGSMEPTLSRGDMVILRKVSPADLRVGDVAQVEIPRAFQEQFGLPPNTLHRIIDIQQTGTNVQFITKGDNNANIDPVPVAPDRVGGVVVGSVPQVGHLFLFLNSAQGRMFALLMGVSVVGYILYVTLSDNWRNVVVAAQVKAGVLSPDAAKQAHETGGRAETTRETPAGLAEGDPAAADPLVLREDAVASTPDASDSRLPAADLRLIARVDDGRLEDIETGIHETRDSLRHFSTAIAEYSTHLRSHTATVQAMAAASEGLVEAVRRQNGILERLETAVDRETDEAGSVGKRRRSPRRSPHGQSAKTPESATGSSERPEEANVDASVDDRPASASVNEPRRRRVTERQPTKDGVDFRNTLRIVSSKRGPRPPRRG